MSGMNITANDIVTILKAARASKVTKLKIGELEVEFDTNFHPNKTKFNTGHKDVVSDDYEGLEIVPQLSNSDIPQEPIYDEQLLFMEHLDQLSIENPAEYEAFQLKQLNQG